MSDFEEYGRNSSAVDPFVTGSRFKEAEDEASRNRARVRQTAGTVQPNRPEPEWGSPEYIDQHRATEGRMDSQDFQESSDDTTESSKPRGRMAEFLDGITVIGREPGASEEGQSRATRFADRLVGKVLGETATPDRAESEQASRARVTADNVEQARATSGADRVVNAADASALRAGAGQQVTDVAAFLSTVEQRRSDGAKVPEARSMSAVLGEFKGFPISQTRIQVLAAAATARHLEGPESENALKLNQLVEDNAARLQSLRDEERHRAGIEHEKNGTPQADIDAEEKARTEREAVEDKRVFNAASAVSLGYVAAKGLPSYEQLAELSEAQLGSVPEEVEPEAETGTGGRSGMQDVLNAAGKGLAQAVGPVVGDDDVAPNLSPVNLAQFNEEMASIAAGMAPAMRAAMSSHPRSVKELLNADQKVDEKSAFFESDQDLNRELEEQQEQKQESEREV